MDKIWYLFIDDIQEGPYSLDDLKLDLRITPDSLVWREGLSEWTPIRKLPELKEIFEDKADQEEEEQESIKLKAARGKEELALDAQRDLPPALFFIIILLLLLFYIVYRQLLLS